MELKGIIISKTAARKAKELAKRGRNELQQELWRAVRAGDSEQIASLIAAGTEFRRPDAYGVSLLGHAIRSGHLESVDALIRLGVDPDQSTTRAPSVMDAIWQRKPHLIPALIERGANVNARDPYGNTALLIATQLNQTETVRVLLHHGADAATTDRDGKDVMYWAKKEKNTEIIRILKEAGAAGNPRMERELEAITAAELGKARLLQKLLNEGVDVNTRDTIEKDRRTLLMIAAAAGKRDCVELLLKAGAELEAKNATGATALFYAAEHGHTTTINALLDAGANVKHTVRNGSTALDYAFEWNHEKAIRLLLTRGMNWKLGGKARTTTTLCLASHAGFTAIVNRLLRAGADPNRPDDLGMTALMWAASAGQISVARRLVKAGAKVNAQDKKGATPLIWALVGGGPRVQFLSLREDDEPEPPREASSTEMVGFLISKGADVHLKDKEGLPPLMWASNVADAKALISAGADVNDRDTKKKRAVDWARERGHHRLAQFLATQVI